MRESIKWLLLMIVVALNQTGFSQSLTLKEKMAIANLDFSWSEKRILDNYGSAVRIELDPSSVSGDMDAILFAESRGAQVAANAIARICDHPLAKAALQSKKITTVIIRNIREGKYNVEIKAGTLTLFTGLSSSDNYYSDSELSEAIENKL